MPIYSKFKDDKPDSATSLFCCLSGLLFLFSLSIASGLYFFPELWISILVPGFADSTADIATMFLKVMAIGVPFFFQTSILSFLEISHGHYFLASARPGILSLGLIASALTAFVTQNPVWLSWGFTLSFVVMTGVGYKIAAANNIPLLPSTWHWPSILDILLTFWLTIRPLLLLPFMYQGWLFLERMAASMQGPGVLSSLDYGKTISEVGIAMIAAPLGLTSLAEFSKISFELALPKIQRISQVLFLLLIPFSIGLIIFSTDIVTLIFNRGAFDTKSVQLTSLMLTGLSVGFWAQVTGYFLLKIINAQRSNELAMRYSAIALVTAILTLFPGTIWFGPIALGLSTSIYGISLFALTASYFKLWSIFFSTLTKLIIPTSLACGLIYVATTLKGEIPFYSFIKLGLFILPFALSGMADKTTRKWLLQRWAAIHG